ncbi:MAG: hypothetical protein ACT452_12970 [Microthrixaceae bacterium]
MNTWRRFLRWSDGISKAEVAALSVAVTLVAAMSVAYPIRSDRASVGAGSATDLGFGEDEFGAGNGAEGGDVGPGGTGAGGTGRGGTGPGGTGPGGTGPGGTTLRATDQGVTATEVKIGFVINNLGGLQGSGMAQGLREDVQDVVEAYVSRVNKTGGIGGRKVKAEFAQQDPLNANSVQAACVELAEQKKVFGVVNPIGTDPCYALKYKLPHTTENLQRQKDLLKRAPYEASTYINGDRSDLNWVHEANAAGFFTKEYDGRPPVFGLLAHANTEPGPGHVEETLKPALKSIGVEIAAEYRITPNPARAASEMALAVEAMKQKGVTRMFLSIGFIDVTNFLNQAESQLFRPKYFASDLGSHTQNFQAQNFNPTQWDNTEAVTSTHSGQSAAGKPLSAAAKACSDILVAEGVPGIKDDSDLIAITYCDTFFVMVAAARAAGPELTRPAWGQALQQLGEFPSAYTALSVFGPNKFDGGDKVARIRWRSSCRCWVQVSDFKPGFG